MDPLKSYSTFSPFNTDGFSPYLLQMAGTKKRLMVKVVCKVGQMPP